MGCRRDKTIPWIRARGSAIGRGGIYRLHPLSRVLVSGPAQEGDKPYILPKSDKYDAFDLAHQNC